jgi:hypothetical protein
MIDSSGRRALRANGTVLDLLPIGQAILIIAMLLVVLFSLIKPEASNGLGTLARIGFWTLHVLLGLLAIQVASLWLASGEFLPQTTLGRVLLTGAAGVLIAAPGYLMLDSLYAPYIIDLDPDPEQASVVSAMLKETLELTPWFLATWVLINLPVFLPSPNLTVQLNDHVEHNSQVYSDNHLISEMVEPTQSQETSLHTPSSPATASPAGIVAAEEKNTELPANDTSSAVVETKELITRSSEQQAEPISQRFLASLPGVVGTDIIAIASDLHYLNVWTVAGRTTVLGNLRDVVKDLGDVGLQVHRSHWVAHAHVRRIVGTASDGACILSNELRVPISRRRWKDVREQYGRGVIHTSDT